MIRVYTSANKYYLPKARVLAESVKKTHPEYWFCLVLSDSLPDEFNLDNEAFDEVLTIEELGINDLQQWIFKHTVVELCTAVKGRALVNLLRRPETDAVFYLDPDIWLLGSLSPVADLFNQYDVLLTPHLLCPEDDIQLIHGNEIVTTLAHGIYNLGFIGVNNSEEGMRFAQWWEERLLNFCFDDVPLGLFTDQRWCDHVPAFFPTSHIVRDVGCNVATWNIMHRPITKENGQYLADGSLLRFYHFTGFDSGENYDNLLKRFASGYPAAFELWEEYGKELSKSGNGDPAFDHWAYARFDNGELISKRARKAYRSDQSLQARYPDPFDSQSNNSYFQWCIEHNVMDDGVLNPEEEVYRLQRELSGIYHSLSWKVARSLRWLFSALLMRRG